ncbi:hypothetical protein F5B18DRAFT_398705 [Nemania serpens]|nr:hypothetical protein F5B18DRAFT_398705 [Nemania serpens]
MAVTQLPVLLHLVPVISSTSSLWYAWDQYEQMTVFRQPEMRSISNRILPRYFAAFFRRGAPRVLGLLVTTAVSSGAILRYSLPTDPRAQSAFPWHVAGLLLATAHLAWAPAILPSVRAIENDAKDKNVAQLDLWLRLHAWRSLTVDMGAWICCIIAAIKSL